MIPATDGHYESFYLKAAAPGGGRAVWIRHTVHKRPNQEPTGAVWMTYFDRERPAPLAAKRQVGANEVSTPRDSYIRVGDSEIAPGRMQGIVNGGGVEASWSLRFSDHYDAMRHFPSQWMYERALPRTKLLSPHPGASFDGILEIDGERIAVEAWPGMVGHNWGAEHAENWVWIHGATLADDGSQGYVDIAGGRVNLGPWTTPWVLNGQIVHAGQEYRVGGISKVRNTKVDVTPTSCEFSVPGDGFTVRGRVEGPIEQFVGWVYADPVGSDHHALHCSICDLDLMIEGPRQSRSAIRVEGGATYELGTRQTDHGIPIRPFPDG